MLHWVALASHPVPATGLDVPEHGDADADDLRAALADQWHGLLPGFHRLCFDDGHVLLTLCVGDTRPLLRAQHFEADEIVVDAATLRGDVTVAAPMAVVDLAKALARFARPGTLFKADDDTPDLRDALKSQGFRLRPLDGADRGAASGLVGEFAPAWRVRRRSAPSVEDGGPVASEAPGHCIVVGAGLAGAAVAASLARRGWRVTVLDAGTRAATGASGVPAGVFAPHVSSDDALLSRLTRAGLRLTHQQLRTRLREGVDWHDGGVLERRTSGDDRLPADWRTDGPNESWHATPERLTALGLPVEATALWHARAGWVRPARLVEAWLASPGVTLQTGARVARIAPVADGIEPRKSDGTGDFMPGGMPCRSRWTVLDVDGRCLAEGDRVVVAAGFESAALATGSRIPLQRVRGQLAWGRMGLVAGLADALPTAPLNGDGHLIAHVPDAAGAFWLTGATFDRDRDDVGTSASDTGINLTRLARLHPAAHALLTGVATTTGTRRDTPEAAMHRRQDAPPRSDGIHAWAGVRCASSDRRPLVGPLDPGVPGGPWLCTAMGSRGLSFAVLCAELLAARWHGEPLPLPVALAQALDTARVARVPRR